MLVDLSMPLSPKTPPVPGHPEPTFAPLHLLERDGLRNTVMSLSLHTATHIDAPSHFIADGAAIDEIAIGLAASPFEVCKLLYGLITSGLVSLREDLATLRPERLQRLGTAELGALAERIHRAAQQAMSGHERSGELDAAMRLSRAELDGQRGVDAVIDLIRAHEKTLSASLGPNQSKAFLDRIGQLIAGV